MDSRPLGSHRMVALVPARAGSVRVKGKNTRILAGKPLFVWSVLAAQASKLFEAVIVSTDSSETADAAREVGALVHVRQAHHATADAPDHLWVRDALQAYPGAEIFSILRPTSPFRTAGTIRRAYAQFIASGMDSLRAVEPVRQHPAKMWRVVDSMRMVSYEPLEWINGAPMWSSPLQVLDPVYVQNASLEMAWTATLRATGTISGHRICPFLTDPLEGFDINTEDDWLLAEAKAARYLV